MVTWILDQHDASKAEDSYDAGEMPNVISNLGGTPVLLVADPVVVQDLLVTKNAHYDKTGAFEGFFSNLIGKSFLFSQAHETWKIKRQAAAHAFYKDRLAQMLNVLKDKALEVQTKWAA